LPIASPATVPEMLVGISYDHRFNMGLILQAHRIAVVAFHPGVFQGIVFFLREAMAEDIDN